MSVKKSVSNSSSGSLPAVKIGSRVRCTDDGVEGRITWANGVSVKVQWDDGEQVTWRRDSLADRPIEILDRVDEEGQAAANPEPAPVEPSASNEVPAEEPPLAPLVIEEATSRSEQPVVETAASAAESAAAEPAPPRLEPTEGQSVPAPADAKLEKPMAPKRRRTSAAAKEKKLSALDAAVKVLAETGQPMSCSEMIAAMAEKGYWTSPGGQTPSATLYSAMLREITVKGAASRFVKTERGKFALGGAR